MTNFNYSARDYDTIKSDLLARAEKVLPEWTERDPSDFGMLLVDLWAYMGDVQHYYIDRSASEAFLETATQRESVLALANLFDYKPVAVAAATGTVTVANSTASDYTVDKDTLFTARANGKNYLVHAADITTIPATGSAGVNVVEGNLIADEILTDSASGSAGQTYTVAKAGCAPLTVRIEVFEDGVNATPYAYVSSLTSSQAGSRVFTTRTGADNFVEILFGDAVNGLAPPTGATITATYSDCSGLEGNLPANAVTSFAQATGTGITVSSSTALSGGEDAETIASMKQSIPSVIATQNRAVTSDDFVSLARTVPGVAKAAIEYIPVVAGEVKSVTEHGTAAGVATLTIVGHGYQVGDAVRIDGVDDVMQTWEYNGVRRITSVPDVDTITFLTDGTDVTFPVAASGTAFLVTDSTAKMYLQETRSDYLTTADTSQTVDTDLRTDTEAFLQSKALLGVTVTTAATIQWEEIDITAEVFVNAKAITNTVSSAVENALDQLFAFDNVHFGQLLHLGQIHRIILNVPGVDYVVVSKFDTTAGGPTSVQNSLQIADYTLPKKNGTSGYTLTFTGGISTS